MTKTVHDNKCTPRREPRTISTVSPSTKGVIPSYSFPSMNISSIAHPNVLAILNANDKDGLNLPLSIDITVCLETPIFSENSS
jgi:hypothetical protein